MTRRAIQFSDDFARADGALGTAADGHVWTQYSTGRLVIASQRAVQESDPIYMEVIGGPVMTRIEAWVRFTDAGGGGNGSVVLHSSNGVQGHIAGANAHYKDFIHAVFGNLQFNLNIYQDGGPGPTLGGLVYTDSVLIPDTIADGNLYYLGYDLDVSANTMRVWLPVLAETELVRPAGSDSRYLDFADALIGAVGGGYTIWQIYTVGAPAITPVFEAVRVTSGRVTSASRTASPSRTLVASRAAA